jgi:phage terminase large subunit
MAFPRVYFDREHTVRLRECLKRYRRIIPATTDEPSNPCHDEFSHGADAFRYMSMVADRLGNDDMHKGPIKYPKLAYA